MVKGFIDSKHPTVLKFLNIPFATVTKRWHPASKPRPWKGLRDATKQGSGSEEIRYEDHYNEANCLNLNIYMPSQVPTDAKLPVMVFIFGGGLKSGGNGVPLYDCTNFVAQSAALHKPVVAVVINYRLNYFGFLASKELRTETQGDSIGNLGLLDQILALQWVQDHIHIFAGNKDNVTVVGHSSGATSIGCLMLSKRSWGLFQKAVLQSSGTTTFGVDGLSDVEKVEALRRVPEKDLAKELNTSPVQEFMPYIDGVVLKEDVRTMVGDPRNYDPKLKWLLAGSCHDDATAFAEEFSGRTVAMFTRLRARLCPASDFAIFDRLYGTPATDAEALALSVKIVNDGMIKYPLLAQSLAFFDMPGTQLSRYHFDRSIVKVDTILPTFGAFHGVDLAYNFGTDVVLDALTTEERAFMPKVQQVWIDFLNYDPEEAIMVPKSSGTGQERSDLVQEGLHDGEGRGRDPAPEEEVFWRRSYANVAIKVKEGYSSEYEFSMLKQME
ncbi:hypothetical protein BGZ52_000170 [Haplosporangium bisporale]|nr:hypothetical protein BGZ52_000170 [Haplosporangium bisporale]